MTSCDYYIIEAVAVHIHDLGCVAMVFKRKYSFSECRRLPVYLQPLISCPPVYAELGAFHRDPGIAVALVRSIDSTFVVFKQRAVRNALCYRRVSCSIIPYIQAVACA